MKVSNGVLTDAHGFGIKGVTIYHVPSLPFEQNFAVHFDECLDSVHSSFDRFNVFMVDW